MVTTPIENDENLSNTTDPNCYNGMEGQVGKKMGKDNVSKVDVCDSHRKTAYRRSRSEDPNLLFKHSKLNLRVALKPPDPPQEELTTPLLDSDGDVKHRSRSTDQPLCENHFFNGKEEKESRKGRRCLRHRKRYTVLAITILALFSAVVYLFIEVKNQKAATPPMPKLESKDCEVFEANLDEDILKTAQKQSRYYLHWRYDVNTSMKHIRSSNGEVFEALQTGNFKINLKIHINTYHWISVSQTKHFNGRLCLISSEKKEPEYCVVKIQLIGNIDSMVIDRVVKLKRGQQIRFVLLTNEDVNKILKSSQKLEINKLQIHKENC